MAPTVITIFWKLIDINIDDMNTAFLKSISLLMTKWRKRFVIHQIAYPPMCLLFMLQRFLCKRRQCTQHLRVYNSHKLCFKMKMTKVYSKHLLMKSSRNNFIFLLAFYLIMCLMKAPKNFGKIAILKIWELDSLKVSKLTSVN